MSNIIQKLIDEGGFIELTVFNHDFAMLETEGCGWRKSYRGTPGEILLDAGLDMLTRRINAQEALSREQD